MKAVLFLLMMTTYSLMFGQINYNPSLPEGDVEIFKVVENMPRFPGCENLETDSAKDKCSKVKMLEFINMHLKYPEEAKTNKTEGNVVLQFIVDTDGILKNIKVVRDIGFGCGQAAVDVIALMNEMSLTWIPGSQRTRKVRVLYTLPIKFKLTGK
ncbi:MAG: energy transducer TonB [Saprospiraceae bacterium]|nr:energy transducer TonB [Saprospiraceae bacterium]